MLKSYFFILLRTFYNGVFHNFWCYPLLNILNFIQLTIVITISTFIVIGLYKTGELMNSIFWSNYEIMHKNSRKFI
jgi:hypothetical protein